MSVAVLGVKIHDMQSTGGDRILHDPVLHQYPSEVSCLKALQSQMTMTYQSYSIAKYIWSYKLINVRHSGLSHIVVQACNAHIITASYPHIIHTAMCKKLRYTDTRGRRYLSSLWGTVSSSGKAVSATRRNDGRRWERVTAPGVRDTLGHT